MRARQYFEEVREAARDAERIRKQLVSLEQEALRIAGPSFEPSRRGVGNRDTMGRRVARYVDTEDRLHRRMESDYAVIDQATAILYGPEQDGQGGVAEGCGMVHGDVLWWRWLADSPWKQVASVLALSRTTVQGMERAAFAWLDDGARLDMMLEGHPLPLTPYVQPFADDGRQ